MLIDTLFVCLTSIGDVKGTLMSSDETFICMCEKVLFILFVISPEL